MVPAGFGGGLFFNFGSDQDYENSQNVIAFARPVALACPTATTTPRPSQSVDIRKKYLAHVQAMFELLGDKPDLARAEAAKVMEIETALARAPSPAWNAATLTRSSTKST